ncbi:MAG TPA: sulfur oxidation c-type cytochrome SoxX [Burkholderiales bacterium]|nr:sulfur oxidation c-type cytochrome SoxX [Burkholderiales bacterium]
MKLAAALLLPIAAYAGNPENGRAIVTGNGEATCLLCHRVPGTRGPQGDIGPSLAGVGARLGAAELKARIADASRNNPDTVMPPYGRTQGLYQVAARYRGKPLLSDEQIDDVVAFLLTLR